MARNESAIRETMHDMNNSLAAILGSAELILVDAEHGSQIATDARNICLASLRGRELIGTLRKQLDLK